MSFSNPEQWLQAGMRVALGATGVALDLIQDPQKRAEGLAQVTQETRQVLSDLAQRGEQTEQEARRFVSTLFPNLVPTPPPAAPAPTPTEPVVEATLVTSPSPVSELTTLTAEIATLRQNLEQAKS
ncbi:MAG: hypothetical protein IGQ88_06565 [Gloeomargaritaceae cyanobacterium C42_A2020_066]|nr:hypothetical protein [Gloeomargaritaceae cyanobacterium C42_A2020_066]